MAVPAGTLVRLRCMVQDVFDPEYYMGVYELRHKSSREKVLFPEHRCYCVFICSSFHDLYMTHF